MRRAAIDPMNDFGSETEPTHHKGERVSKVL